MKSIYRQPLLPVGQTQSAGNRTVPTKSIAAKRQGFSLVEVALALGIVGFGIAAIIGMIPLGLTNFKKAMNNTVQAAIVQRMTNDIALADFGTLKDMAGSQGKIYHFDESGEPLTSAQGAIYTAELKFTDLSPSQAPHPLSSLGLRAGTTALITITDLGGFKDYFSVIVGNNQPAAAQTPATW